LLNLNDTPLFMLQYPSTSIYTSEILSLSLEKKKNNATDDDDDDDDAECICLATYHREPQVHY